jgi:lipopolysaccharide export system permease protein
MKIIDKHLLKEHLTPVFYCLFGFTLLTIIVDLLGNLSSFIDAKLPAIYIAKFYLCSMGEMIDYLLPAALLFATLYVLWHLTHSNELMAIRASGMSFYRMMLPFMVTGLTFSLLLIALKLTIIPHGLQWKENLSSNDFVMEQQATSSDITYYNQQENRIWKMRTYIAESPTNSTTIYNLQLIQERENGARNWVMDAKKAQFLDGEWWFFDVSDIIYYDELDNPVENQSNLFSADESHLMRIHKIKETPVDIDLEQKNWDYLTLKERYMYLNNHPEFTDINAKKNKKNNARKYDIYDTFSFPFSCLIVILFAIPTGAKTARSNPLSTIFIAILAFFAYYSLYILSEYLCKSGMLPPLFAAWMANLVFLAIGSYMTIKMH